MARVGTFPVGTALVSRQPLTVAAQAAYDVFAGAGPSTPGRTVPLRARCATICTFDPATWTVGAPILGVVAGSAARRAQLTEPGFQQETLQFTTSAADAYLGAAAGTLAPGAWLAVQWTTAVAGATATTRGGVYIVAAAARRERSGAGTLLVITAVDWFQWFAARYDAELSRGQIMTPALDRYRQHYIESGLPSFGATTYDPGASDNLGNTLGGILLARLEGWGFTTGPAPLRVTPFATMTTSWVLDEGSSGLVLPAVWVFGTPDQPSTLYDFLRILYARCGGFYLSYAADGALHLLPGGDRAMDSGAYLTSGPDPLGAVPLPWAAPLVRDVSQRPEFDGVSYTVHRDPAPQPPPPMITTENQNYWPLAAGAAVIGDGGGGGGGGGGGAIVVREWYYPDPAPTTPVPASVDVPTTLDSWSAVHPVGTGLRGREAVVDTLAWYTGSPYLGGDLNNPWQSLGYLADLTWCRAHLRDVLAACDTVSLRVDPAYPPPPLGQLVRLHFPPLVDGWYKLVGFSQPHGAQLASWSLTWWEDAGMPPPPPPPPVGTLTATPTSTTVPATLYISWSGWVGATAADFIGIYGSGDPITADPGAARGGAVLTGGAESGSLTLAAPGDLVPGLYYVGGWYAGTTPVTGSTLQVVGP